MRNKIIISFILLLVLVLNTNKVFAQNYEEIFVANYNLENLFDTVDDPDKNDSQFLPDGDKNWTEEKLSQKLENLSRIIRYMNDMRGPDLLGVQEVEHEHLLQRLIDTHFCDKNYKISYAESLDKRGIDNGLIYNADKFEFVSKETYEVKLSDNYPTRYVFYTKLKYKNEIIHVFVNHWPSRRGGSEKSEPNRIAAASVLRTQVDLLFSENKNANIIILGDFNDETNNKSLTETLKAEKLNCKEETVFENRLFNLAINKDEQNLGSYLYRGNWNMLDHIIVSGNMINKKSFSYKCDSFNLINPEFIITKSGNYKGASIPTFGGRKYLGGFSDHLGVVAKFLFIQSK